MMSQKISPIEKARLYCETNNHRFTEPRKYVLQILLNNKNPMGAYDVLAKLGDYINKPKPPTAYRAIDFWREHGFVHKIESLNSFIACCDGHLHHDTHFLVCDDCHTVSELNHHHHAANDIPDGFTAKRTLIETHGTCGSCAQEN